MCVLCPVLDCVGVELCCTWGPTSVVNGTDLSILMSHKDRPTPTHLAFFPYCALESLSLVYSLFSVSLSQFPYMSFFLPTTTVFLKLSFSVSPHSFVSPGISVYLLFSSASQRPVHFCAPMPDFPVHLCLFGYMRAWGSDEMWDLPC